MKKHDHSGMAMRGVTRPMAEQEIKKKFSPSEDHDQPAHAKGEGHEHHMMMKPEQRNEMLHMHHMQTLWVYWLIVMLGCWMVLSPVTFSHSVGTVEPSGGRSVWLSLSQRIAAMTWSDIISGVLLIVFGWRGLRPNRPVSLWICCFVGVWLSIAPVVFWAPTAAAYLNNTLVGMLVISLTILIPGMPNMIMYMKMGPQTPPGWSYNPSSWPQRWIMIVLGFVGFVVSRYLAAFQLGYIDHVWDPFFVEGSRLVLNSDMSHSLPVSDGALGSLAYTFEFLMGFMGGPARWRTMPWMVTFFGILVIPLGLVHIFLVMSQPILVGHWCSMCLLAAAIMLPMLPLEVDEVVAMGQYLKKAKQKGQSMWEAFWKGGTLEEGEMDQRSPALMELSEKPGKVFWASIWGMSAPWTLVASTVLGIFLIAAPGLFGVDIETTAADIAHGGGALIVVVAVICMGEVVRIGRYLNVPIGLAVAALPWFFEGGVAFDLVCTVAGLAVAALALPRGNVTETYGGWDE
ncbi:Vitamin K epoxide reductase family protein, partial [Catalinimonas alkaloidigena]